MERKYFSGTTPNGEDQKTHLWAVNAGAVKTTSWALGIIETQVSERSLFLGRLFRNIC